MSSERTITIGHEGGTSFLRQESLWVGCAKGNLHTPHSIYCAGLGGAAQGHPSLEGRTKSRRSYLNELVEATMLDTDSQVRIRYYSMRSTSVEVEEARLKSVRLTFMAMEKVLKPFQLVLDLRLAFISRKS